VTRAHTNCRSGVVTALLTLYLRYGSSDISLGRLFWYRRFDYGMVAFLGCLKEVVDYAESKDKNFRVPYKYVAVYGEALIVFQN
jgi:beclin 1